MSLLFAELAVRLIRPQAVMTVSRGLYRPDPPRRYRIAPGFRGSISNQVEFDTEVSTNSLGLRGPEVGPKRGLRILALGDSFTFGVGARQEKTWPARLAKILGAEVLNAGAPGFGVPDAVGWYEQYGVKLDPDVVVLTVFLANDLQDASPDQPKVAVVDGALVVPGETGGLRRWLYYHSHLFRLLKTSVLEGGLRTMLGLREPWAVRELRSEFAMYSPNLPEELQRGAEATEKAVGRLAGKKVLAVLIPSLPQVDPAKWKAVLAQLGLDPAQHDPLRPNRLFRGIFERHRIPVLDLTDTFRKAGKRIYYPIDQHLTPEGYELMARSVAEALR
ncbi:MAG TPA: GDSL-type esterase/lipase family protein [Thermoanaerobaculia bacterium]|nr:GDSL-type esterase/lipase family protein [Thermoanaerobaculia bacterium]